MRTWNLIAYQRTHHPMCPITSLTFSITVDLIYQPLKFRMFRFPSMISARTSRAYCSNLNLYRIKRLAQKKLRHSCFTQVCSFRSSCFQFFCSILIQLVEKKLRKRNVTSLTCIAKKAIPKVRTDNC